MKKAAILLILAGLCTSAQAQRMCGFSYSKANLVARDSSWLQQFEAQRAAKQGTADSYKRTPGAAERTTSAAAVPVIFHFLLTTDQYNQLGGLAGIEQRISSQIDVLNQDYNKQNADSTGIPSGWKSRYANVGIHFGLAHTAPTGWSTPGYEIRYITDSTGFSDVYSDYSEAKHSATGGLDAWDVTKYMNIWCMNFTYPDGLLGITTSLSQTGFGGYPVNEEGECINYACVGKRANASDYYIGTGYSTAGVPDYYDMGRTITHETGHFFEIWHTWGDDGGLCPWNGGSDDGLGDTPPEADHKFYNYPNTITGGTYYDDCQYDGVVDTQLTMYGVASLDYMNYTDDIAMHLFTPDQAAVMASQVAVGGENYSLTQNGTLLNWPANTAVKSVNSAADLNIYPNPSHGQIYLAFTPQTGNPLQSVSISDVLGREVYQLTPNSMNNIYSIDLSMNGKGIYFVKCTFASGSVTRKILIQ